MLKFMKMENCSSVFKKKKSEKMFGKWKNYFFKRVGAERNIPLTGKVLHRSKLLRFGILKVYSIKRDIPLTDIPLSGLHCR